jgi:hypothetical protein
MMNIGAADAREMTLYEYEMRLHHWNEAHATEDTEIVDPDITQRLIDKLNSRPDLMTSTKGEKRPHMPARL